jgi:hypothetical protein
MSTPGRKLALGATRLLPRSKKKGLHLLQAIDCLARPAGFELTTPWFVFFSPVESAIIINDLRCGGPRMPSDPSAAEPD